MKNLINFILWPALVGLIFSAIFLKMPDVVSKIPALSAYISAPVTQHSDQLQAKVISYSEAIKKAAPAVVSFSSRTNTLRPAAEASSNSMNFGSGVIISQDGYVITSYHYFSSPGTNKEDRNLNKNQNNTITLRDGRSLEAQLVSVDEDNNLALLKVDADNLAFINLTSELAPEVGDIVLAIGNPRNVGQSVSMGIVSALLEQDDGHLIQTDAAINPGNSGGALIDIDGGLIGINSTIVSASGGSEGIGFAITADKAFNLLNRYLAE